MSLSLIPGFQGQWLQQKRHSATTNVVTAAATVTITSTAASTVTITTTGAATKRYWQQLCWKQQQKPQYSGYIN
jgi:hypothetical protein